MTNWYSARSPKDVVEKLQQLHRYGENPYWAKTDVRRYPFAPPVVSVNDYRGYLWEKAFYPDLNATAEEAYSQLDLLTELKDLHTKEFSGYWNGRRYPSIHDPIIDVGVSFCAPISGHTNTVYRLSVFLLCV